MKIMYTFTLSRAPHLNPYFPITMHLSPQNKPMNSAEIEVELLGTLRSNACHLPSVLVGYHSPQFAFTVGASELVVWECADSLLRS